MYIFRTLRQLLKIPHTRFPPPKNHTHGGEREDMPLIMDMFRQKRPSAAQTLRIDQYVTEITASPPGSISFIFQSINNYVLKICLYIWNTSKCMFDILMRALSNLISIIIKSSHRAFELIIAP